MTSINEKDEVAKLPAVELMTSLQAFLEPVLGQLPEVRLHHTQCPSPPTHISRKLASIRGGQ